MRPRGGRSRLSAGLAAGATTAAWWWVRQLPAATDPAWQRRNYRDREVSLLLGPAVAAGTVVGLGLAARVPRRAPVLAVAVAALVGGYDDRYGDSHARGLGGHLRALRQGRVTTGLVKLATLTAAAAGASRAHSRSAVDTAVNTVLVAGTANLINLFDLRPGRAAKVTVLAAAGLSRVGDPGARAVAAVAGGAAAAALPADLGEAAMLGDCGAGALGMTLGWSLAGRRSRLTRLAAAAGVVGLTLASERVSFSQVIDDQPVLRALDRLGRRERGRLS